MSAIAGIKALQIILTIIRNMPEEQKKYVDAALDKVEDKFKEGSIKDEVTEFAIKILRGINEIPDYTDETKNDSAGNL